MELVPLGCHGLNAAEVAICNFKAHFLSIRVGYPTTFLQAYGTGYSPKPKSQSTSFDNLMPPQMCQHMCISVAHLTTTKCRSPGWDATHRYMRKPTSKAHGHFIWWTDGISSHHQDTIAHIMPHQTHQKQMTVQHHAIPTQMHH